jgi:hypothetical protein
LPQLQGFDEYPRLKGNSTRPGLERLALRILKGYFPVTQGWEGMLQLGATKIYQASENGGKDCLDGAVLSTIAKPKYPSGPQRGEIISSQTILKSER